MDTLPYPSRPTNKQTILNVFRVRVCVSVCVRVCVCVCSGFQKQGNRY
jgi:hypothetical protein